MPGINLSLNQFQLIGKGEVEYGSPVRGRRAQLCRQFLAWLYQRWWVKGRPDEPAQTINIESQQQRHDQGAEPERQAAGQPGMPAQGQQQGDSGNGRKNKARMRDGAYLHHPAQVEDQVQSSPQDQQAGPSEIYCFRR